VTERCPFCGQTSGVIWVRAHYQCAACGQVVVPCCNGETADACPGHGGSPANVSSRTAALSASENSTNGKDS
jgi:hypothetical protein